MNLPEIIKDNLGPAWNTVKAILPFFVSQSEVVSDKYVNHKANMAKVDIIKEIIIDEGKVLNAAYEDTLKQFVNCNEPRERIRLRQDIQYIEESKRALLVGLGGIVYLNEDVTAHDAINAGADVPEIKECWLDIFTEIAKRRNEPWRNDLLSKALAVESKSPGTVSQRALWIIGTLEEELFNAFATMLNISIALGIGPMIPSSDTNALDVLTSDCVSGNSVRVGTLVLKLSDVGLITMPLATKKTFVKGNIFFAEYGSSKYKINCKDSDLVVNGIIYTGIGDSIAGFYNAKPIEKGYEVLDNWIDTLDKTKFEVTKIQ